MLDKLVDFIIQSLRAFQCGVVVHQYEGAVLLRLGVFKRELKPGFHWLLPFFIDFTLHEYVVPRTERISGLSTTTRDGKSVGFDAVVTYRISDIVKATLEVHDLKDAIADSCAGIIGTQLSESSWEDIRNGTAVEALTSACRKRGWKWGVEIQGVQLTGVAIVKNLRVALSDYHAAPREHS